MWYKSKKGAKVICSFELSGTEILSKYDKTKSIEALRRTKKLGAKKMHIASRAYDTGQWWKQGNIKIALNEDHASCCVHKDLIITTKQIQALLTAARASGGKDECQVPLTGIEREYWMGTKIGKLGGRGFRGSVTAGGGSNQKGGKNGSRSCESTGKKQKAAAEDGTQRERIQREPSGTSGCFLGITRHPCDKTHALFVRQPTESAAESCEKMGR